METVSKMKYSRTDRLVLGIGYAILGLFVLSIVVPLVYVVLASFMDPTVLNNQGLSFHIKDWTLDAYRRVLENGMIWRGFLNSFLYSLAFAAVLRPGRGPGGPVPAGVPGVSEGGAGIRL